MRYREDFFNYEADSTEFEVVSKTLIIHINGELDHHNAVNIREIADKKIYDNSIKNILFDFEQTNFMDSSGIGVIMGRYKMVHSLGGKVGVINARKNVEKILLFSGLNKIIRKYDCQDNAIADMNGGENNE